MAVVGRPRGSRPEEALPAAAEELLSSGQQPLKACLRVLLTRSGRRATSTRYRVVQILEGEGDGLAADASEVLPGTSAVSGGAKCSSTSLRAPR